MLNLLIFWKNENGANFRHWIASHTSDINWNIVFLDEKVNSRKSSELIIDAIEDIATDAAYHLQFQKNSNTNGIINNEFNKNHKANLINICTTCHNKIHNENKEYKISKSNNGYVLLEI